MMQGSLGRGRKLTCNGDAAESASALASDVGTKEWLTGWLPASRYRGKVVMMMEDLIGWRAVQEGMSG
jgi:hypothetical protein